MTDDSSTSNGSPSGTNSDNHEGREPPLVEIGPINDSASGDEPSKKESSAINIRISASLFMVLLGLVAVL